MTDMTENWSEFLKPSYFGMAEVEKLFRMGRVAVRSKIAKMAKIAKNG